MDQAMDQAAELARAFEVRWGERPRVFRAPGRVNLIGEHTDYNDGFVMPVAIEFSTWAAACPRRDRVLAVHSENFSQSREFNLDDPNPRARANWCDYVYGVAVTLDRAGHRLSGANLLIRGEVPIGSGLSSSAAVEVATVFALLAVSGLTLDLTSIAKLCRRAENEFVGVQSGIMDQFIACHAKAGYALTLDCRSLDYRLTPLPPGLQLAICNTLIHRELASGEYNRRRAECQAGVRYLDRVLPHIRALRDVTPAELERYGGGMPRVLYRRCRHVIAENIRVEQASAALEQGDLETFGRLMRDSHNSLRDDYQVSCPELDTMVEIASDMAGVHGSRMTGGGFGGCTIQLVERNQVEEFCNVIARRYCEATGTTPEIYVSSAADAACEAFETE